MQSGKNLPYKVPQTCVTGVQGIHYCETWKRERNVSWHAIQCQWNCSAMSCNVAGIAFCAMNKRKECIPCIGRTCAKRWAHGITIHTQNTGRLGWYSVQYLKEKERRVDTQCLVGGWPSFWILVCGSCYKFFSSASWYSSSQSLARRHSAWAMLKCSLNPWLLSSLKSVKLLIHLIVKYFKARKACPSSNYTNTHITCHTYNKHSFSIHHNPPTQAGVVWYTKSQIHTPTWEGESKGNKKPEERSLFAAHFIA